MAYNGYDKGDEIDTSPYLAAPSKPKIFDTFDMNAIHGFAYGDISVIAVLSWVAA